MHSSHVSTYGISDEPILIPGSTLTISHDTHTLPNCAKEPVNDEATISLPPTLVEKPDSLLCGRVFLGDGVAMIYIESASIRESFGS